MLSDKELEIIRQKIAQLEVEPPATAWNNIKAEIKPKPFREFWWFAGALFLLGFFIFLNFWKQQNQKAASVPIPVSENKPQTNPKTLGLPPRPAKPVITRKNLKNKALTFLPKLPLNQPLSFTTQPGKLALKSFSSRKGEKPKHSSVAEATDSAKLTENRNPSEQVFADSPTTNAENAHSATTNQAVAVDSVNSLKQLPLSKPDSATVQPTITPANKSQKEKKEDWLLGFFVAPTYAFRSVVSDAPDTLFAAHVKNRNTVSSERFGLELGLQITQPITPQLHWEAAISWLKLKENFTYRSNSSIFDSLQNTRQFVSTYQYGRAQVGLTYYFQERLKSKFNVTVAGGANWLLAGKTYPYYNGQLQDSSGSTHRSLLAKANYNVSVGLGFSKPLGSLFECRLMPTFTYYLGSVYQRQEPFRLRPYTFGLQLTFKRRFSRAPNHPQTPR